MATYSGTGSINKNYKLHLIVSESDVNKSNNTSKVNWKVTLQATGAYNFAQINSTVKVVIDGDTVYNKSSYKTVSANSTITIASGSKTITHKDDGSRSVVCKATYDQSSTASYTPGDMTASGTLALTQIDRGNKATCQSFNIGNNVVIAITKYDNSTTTTVKYTLGTLSGTLAEKTDSTTVGWEASTLASQIYAQIPESNSLSGTISADTYDSSGNKIGETQTSTFKCNVVDSNPIINSVTFSDTLGISTSGNIVRYLSNVEVTINATAQNGANFTGSKTIFAVEDESNKIVRETDNVVTFGTVSSNKLKIQVVDSRGNYSEAKTYEISNFIEYTKPTISYLSALRTGDEALTTALMTIRGEWYNSIVNNVANTLTFKYRYKTSTGSWSEYTTFTPTSSLTGNSFELEEQLTPSEDGFAENETYDIEIQITDALTSDSQTTTLTKSIPITDHWEDDDGAHYNINAEIQQNGLRINGQKVLLNTAAYMNANQSYTLSEKVSEQPNGIVLVWCRYANDVAQDDSFNFTFVPKRFVELKECVKNFV